MRSGHCAGNVHGRRLEIETKVVHGAGGDNHGLLMDAALAGIDDNASLAGVDLLKDSGRRTDRLSIQPHARGRIRLDTEAAKRYRWVRGRENRRRCGRR